MVISATALALAIVAASVQDAPPTTRPSEEPTSQPQRSETGSQPKAVELARQVVKRMGGREAYDNTRFLAFEFFGFRRLAWDRKTNRVRVEGQRREDGARYVILFDADTRQGRAWVGGEPVTDDAELSRYLENGYGAWINDFYWLLMPYKLEDPGVTLRLVEARAMTHGPMADVLEVTFENVGLTPSNKYHVYVSRDSGLVEQWDFFSTAEDTEPRMSTPWLDWKPYGEHRIMLSGDRGQRKLADIIAPRTMPEATFTSPDPVDWASLERP